MQRMDPLALWKPLQISFFQGIELELFLLEVVTMFISKELFLVF
jgi:hypothetical protein